jgi:CDP-diacylglycerol--serine O-phosphatidyltransferase
MVSPLRYPSLKDFRLKGLSTFYFLVLFLFLFILTASKPPVILFVLVLIYILLGPFLFVKDFGLKILGKRKKGLKKDNL